MLLFDADNHIVFQAYSDKVRQTSEIHPFLPTLIGLNKLCIFKGKYEINDHDSSMINNFLLFSLVAQSVCLFSKFLCAWLRELYRS